MAMAGVGIGPSWITSMPIATKPEVGAEIRRLIESQTTEAIADGLQAMMSRPDSAPVLAKVHVPTLIIVGSDDGITTVSDAEFMHRGIPGSRLVVIPRVGHMSNMEAPQEFNVALVEFLGSL